MALLSCGVANSIQPLEFIDLCSVLFSALYRVPTIQYLYNTVLYRVYRVLYSKGTEQNEERGEIWDFTFSS